MTAAFWISPLGEILPVVTSHIAAVIEDPATFRMTLGQIEEVYSRHREPVGLEGHAREEILRGLLKRRCIRIREHRTHWSIQFSTASPKTLWRIRTWARTALRRGIVQDRYAPAHLVGLHDDYNREIEFQHLKAMTEPAT